ncbi:DUF1748-domain-containing protein, partial [Metschnikowia bicuspidata var. bicuspidata NRRL YB-4993]
ISKSLHIGFDLIVVSSLLAGIRRNTGLTPDFDSLGNESAIYYGKKYLDVGEKAFDFSSAWLGSSGYFKRN